MSSIPLVDLGAQYRSIKDEMDATIKSVIDSTRFIGGPEVSAFEAEFAAYCDASHCVGVSSGTSALTLALRACGIGPGDEVITCSNTFVATAEAIVLVGATPILVDASPATGGIDVRQVAQAITGRTRALLPVHLYGHPVDLDPLLELAQRYGLYLVEDAAQAHGARYRGHRVGSQGRVACFSFYPGKNLGAYGDAGAVVTNDPEIAESVRMAADHGRNPGSKYEHAQVGGNDRMDALQAAVLRVKLRHLDEWNQRRREHAAHYDSLLCGSAAAPLTPAPWAESAYHLYIVQVPPQARAGIQQKLADAGIATGIHYPIPVHLQPAYADLGYQQGSLPISEKLADSVLSLPMYSELEADQVDAIAAQLLASLQDGDS